MIRKHVLCANTQFTCAEFFPNGVQVLATGTDRNISYWEVFDGSLVRQVEGSSKGCINWLSINSSGEMFVSGGVDQIVKVFFLNSFNSSKILHSISIQNQTIYYGLALGLSNGTASVCWYGACRTNCLLSLQSMWEIHCIW